MASAIKPKRRSADATAPTTANLADGELAVNTASQTVYVRSGTSIVPVGNYVSLPCYIDGLQLSWVSATAITAMAGTAYIQGSGGLLQAPTAIAKSGLVLTASTQYHVYFFNNAGTPDIELSTTAPAAAYCGTARSKSTDTTRRYIGSVLTDSSANLYKFVQTGSTVMYEASIAGAPFFVLNAGRATTVTNVACSGVVPFTAKIALLIMATVNSSADAAVGNADMSGTLSTTSYLQYVGNGVQTTHPMPLDSSQRFNYLMTATTSTGGFYVRVCGYIVER